MKTQETINRFEVQGRNSGDWERIVWCETKEQAEQMTKEFAFLYSSRRIIEVK